MSLKESSSSSSSMIVILVVFVSTCMLGVGGLRTVRDVTCGSVFKLTNTAFSVRLHSHDIKYGTGSGQQSVTGIEPAEDPNSLWVVKSPHTSSPCVRGEPIRCGTKVRLEHLNTMKNLHSHLFSSPLSNNQEISAFGDNGEGDTGDVWEVQCRTTSWKREDAVQFRHVDTSAYLAVSGNSFGRPINGQLEIVGLSYTDASCYWKTAEGIFLHPTERRPNHPDHNEL